MTHFLLPSLRACIHTVKVPLSGSGLCPYENTDRLWVISSPDPGSCFIGIRECTHSPSIHMNRRTSFSIRFRVISLRSFLKFTSSSVLCYGYPSDFPSLVSTCYHDTLIHA